MRKLTPWSEAKIGILRERYPLGATDTVAPLLPDRSRRSIICMAHRLGINGKNWKTSEDEIFRACYPSESARFIQERYLSYRSILAIRDRARILGVNTQGTKTLT